MSNRKLQASAELERLDGNRVMDAAVERYLGIQDDGERYMGVPGEAQGGFVDDSSKYLGVADDSSKYLGVADSSSQYLGVADDSDRYLGVPGNDGSDRYLGVADDSDRYLGVRDEDPLQGYGLADAAGMVKEGLGGGRRYAWYKDEHGKVDPKKLPAGVEYLPSINRFQYKTWDNRGNIRLRLAQKPPTAQQLENMRRRGDISHSIEQLTAAPTGDNLSDEYWKGVNRGRAHPSGIPTPPTDYTPPLTATPTPPPSTNWRQNVLERLRRKEAPQTDTTDENLTLRPVGGVPPTPTPTPPPMQGRFDMDEWRRAKDASLAREAEQAPAPTPTAQAAPIEETPVVDKPPPPPIGRRIGGTSTPTPAAPTPPPMPRANPTNIIGSETMAQGVTDPNKSYGMRWRIAELDELRPSHKFATMEPNPDFDSELQPRDRARKASAVQIDKIASALNPETLTRDKGELDSGAPIIGGDMQVESGNARVMALLKAKAQFPAQYEKYRQHLTNPELLASMGFDADALQGVQNPVLVREHAAETPEARRKFVVEANASRVLPQSAPEQAQTHADAFRDQTLVKITPNPNMNLDAWIQSNAGSAVAMDFLKSLDANKAAGMSDAAGNLSKAGQDSIENSLFARVYGAYPGGDKLQQELLENVDEDIRRVGTALRDSLPGAAKAEAHLQSVSGDKSMSIAGDLAKAVQQLRAVRKRKMRLGDYLRSYTADRDLTPTQKKLLAFIGENMMSGKKMREFIDSYNQRVVQQSASKDQGGMFGGAMGKPPSKDELIERIIKTEFDNPKVNEHLTMLQQKDRGFTQSASPRRTETSSAALGAVRAGAF